MFDRWAVYLVLFIILLIIVYLIAMSVVTLVDKKIGNISIQMPKIEIVRPSRSVGREHYHGDISENAAEEDIDQEFEKLNQKFKIRVETGTGTEPSSNKKERHAGGQVVTKIGCTEDSDCNIVNGDGRNVCKANGSCHCLSGSGLFCQYGPANYKDPKDMTEPERKRFKYRYRNNFTLQDYKNWLLLYKEDPQHLRHNHRSNLRILVRGGQLTERDVPSIRIKPPMDPADYFQKMYEGGKISVHFPEESATGAMLGYNYNQYNDFISPEKAENTWITGVVDLYTRPLKDDAKELNSYLRPQVTVGTERELVGEEYLSSVKRYQNLSDIRKMRPSGTNVRERKDINESLSTFESSDQNVSTDPITQ